MLHEDHVVEYYNENGKKECLRWIKHYGYTKKEANSILKRSLESEKTETQKPF